MAVIDAADIISTQFRKQITETTEVPFNMPPMQDPANPGTNLPPPAGTTGMTMPESTTSWVTMPGRYLRTEVAFFNKAMVNGSLSQTITEITFKNGNVIQVMDSISAVVNDLTT